MSKKKCVNARTGKLKPGYKFGKGGRCMKVSHKHRSSRPKRHR